MPPPACVPEIVNGRRFVVEVIDDATAAMYRAMTPAQRVLIACDAHDTARLMTAARVTTLHPDWTDEQIQQEVSRRLMRETE